MKKCLSVVSSVLLLSLVSCGEKTNNRKQLSVQNFFQTEKGIYEAKLESLNAHLGDEARGKAIIKLKVIACDAIGCGHDFGTHKIGKRT